MEYNYYSYEKLEAKILVPKLPIWFREVEFSGDEYEGNLTLHSQNEYDEIYGSNAKMEIHWEKKEREGFYYAKEVQQSIELYNAIGFVVISKENTWLRSHEFTFWYGQRTKMMRKRYYREKCIHGIFFCEITERLINLHTTIIDKFYDNFKSFVIKSYNTFICHE